MYDQVGAEGMKQGGPGGGGFHSGGAGVDDIFKQFFGGGGGGGPGVSFGFSGPGAQAGHQAG